MPISVCQNYATRVWTEWLKAVFHFHGFAALHKFSCRTNRTLCKCRAIPADVRGLFLYGSTNASWYTDGSDMIGTVPKHIDSLLLLCRKADLTVLSKNFDFRSLIPRWLHWSFSTIELGISRRYWWLQVDIRMCKKMKTNWPCVVIESKLLWICLLASQITMYDLRVVDNVSIAELLRN